MRTAKLTLPLIACAIAWGQQQSSEDLSGSKAEPAELSISCSVKAAERTAAIVLSNSTSKKYWFQDLGPYIDYAVIVTTTDGKLLPQLAPEQVVKRLNPSMKHANLSVSGRIVTLAPNDERTEKCPLGDLVILPKQGGKFRVKIGRALFTMKNDPLERDPSE